MLLCFIISIVTETMLCATTYDICVFLRVPYSTVTGWSLYLWNVYETLCNV